MLKKDEINQIAEMLWYVPLDKLAEVRALVSTLKDRHGWPEPVDDSDEWTEEDRREFTEASMRHLDETDPWEEEPHDQAG
jgi:hypothetical protein